MIRLVATFDIDLQEQCLVSWPDEEIIAGDVHIGEFTVSICLIKSPYQRTLLSGDNNWTYILEKVIIKVSKQESEEPPPVIPNERGIKDYHVQSSYFDQRITEYGSIARMVYNRLIRFYKYVLHTPYLQEDNEGHLAFKNAKWTDENGEEVGKGTINLVTTGLIDIRGQIGVGKLTPDLLPSLLAAIENQITPQLYEEIISDAQTAFFDNNFKRTVLELAIACEIAIKRKFFPGDSPAGAAFDYMEDKSRIKITILELLDRVAQEAFGRSFRQDNAEDYQNIEFLFRCRNKVAHRGDLSYRDNNSVKKMVDHDTVVTWWKAVRNLMIWLHSNDNIQETPTELP